MSVDWESNKSSVLVNPAYSNAAKEQFNQLLQYNQEWPGHLWMATSGSTVEKWVGLSKSAVLASAQAVNAHLQSNTSDCWALALPQFHVGGLGIQARSYLSQAKVVEYKDKWNAASFYDYLMHTKATLTALVPTQLFDLIQLPLQSPGHLRAIIIGGGKLAPELYQQALAKGWKILPSYGSTECASQIATAPLDICYENPSYTLKLLPHIEARVQEGRLVFKGPSLFSTYAYFEDGHVRFVDPKIDGWFLSADRGEINDNHLTISGRIDDFIKVGGENVDLACLDTILQNLKIRKRIPVEMTLVAVKDARLGNAVHLVLEGERSIEIENTILEAFQKLVLPFERIRCVHWIMEIPKTPLAKIKRNELLRFIQIKNR